MRSFLNSPRLWPRAYQILDTFLFPLRPSSLFPSSFLPFFLLPSSLFPLRPEPNVLGRERAHRGSHQGVWRGKLLGPIGAIFWYCVSTIFGRLWIPRWLPKPLKSFENRFRNRTTPFSTPADIENVPKTTKGCSFLHFCSFSLQLPS